jgi:3',5'-nucleoside bisphosphate phosphatase
LPGVVDLHLHSTASDGVLTPSALVGLCLQYGLRVIALTDHDTTDGVDEALRAASGTGLTVIPGVELSTDIPGIEVHILGMYIDWRQAELQETLAQLRGSRLMRARKMVERLAELGAPLEWATVEALAGDGAVGRPHIARAMVQQKHVSSTSEAFERFIGRGRPAYVDRYKLAPDEAVALILRMNGIPILAHPVIIGADGNAHEVDLDKLLPGLIAAGLQGFEARYPSYTAERTEKLEALAQGLGLVTTGGTDFHGPGRGNSVPGEVWVPISVANALAERHRSIHLVRET